MAVLHSLKFRIAGTIFVLEVIMMAFVLGEVFGELRQSTRQQLAAQEQVALDLMASIGRNALLTGEYAEIWPQLETLKRDPRVVKALLADSRSRVVAASDAALLGRQAGTIEPAAGSTWRSQELKNVSGRLGTIAIEFSNEPLLQAEARSQKLAISIAIVGMTVVAIFALGIGWALTRRLDRLKEAAQRMSEGDLAVKSGLAGKDEIGLLGRSFDVMAARLAEDQTQLVALNTKLEQRVAERTAELSAANAQLSETLATLEQAKDDLVRSERLSSLGSLVAGVAHELNTPLGNGVTLATTITDRVRDFGKEVESGNIRRSALTEFLEFLRKSGEVLVRSLLTASDLVGNFKQLAADQTSAQRRPFDLADIVREVVMAVQPQFKTSPHLVVADVPEGIRMDSFPGPLGQVLTNLLVNALVHGLADQAAGTVRISAASQGERVQLRVSDEGCGIPAEHLGRVFDPFFTTRLGHGGSGLGLHIVYSIVVRVLGGRIEVASPPGSGAVFSLDLPLCAPASAGAGRGSAR